MPRLRRLKQPADISVPTPTSLVELAQNFVSLPRGDYRALAASSATIALSIGFPSCDTRHTSSDEATIQAMDTGWQTAYAAVRMAIEAVKESSDLCPPLKAVVGALFVLMKNYDVSVAYSRTKCILIIYLPPPASSG